MNDIQKSVNNSGFGEFPSAGSPVPAKNSLGIVVKIVVGAVILTVVVAGVALGARIWDPLWNPFRPSPEKMIEKMADKMGEVKTFHSDMNIAIKTTGAQPAQMSIKLNGDSDIADSQNSKTAMNFDFQIADEKTGGNLSLAGEMKTIKDISYFKISKINLPSKLELYLMMFGIDKGKFIGQWLKIDKKTAESLGSGTATNQPELPKEKQEKIKKELESLFKKKKIYNAKEMPDEKVNGKKAYHYILSLDREKIKEIIPELFGIMKESSEGSSKDALEKLGTADMEKLTQSIDQFLDKINGLDVDVWIGKKDYLLYRVKADKEIDASVLKEGANGKLAINFDLKLSKFSQPIKIEAPKKFLDLNDILSFLKSNLPAEASITP